MTGPFSSRPEARGVWSRVVGEDGSAPILKKGGPLNLFFYDTEFVEDGKTIDLISIGIASDGGREYYAINSEAPWDKVKKNPWLVQNVLPNLPEWRPQSRKPGPHVGSDGRVSWDWEVDIHDVRVKPKRVIANEVREFLLEDVPFDTNGLKMPDVVELWSYYGSYDHVALMQLWGSMRKRPPGIPMFTHDIMQEACRLGVVDSLPKPPVEGAHNALTDAYHHLDMWRYLQRERAIRRV